MWATRTTRCSRLAPTTVRPGLLPHPLPVTDPVPGQAVTGTSIMGVFNISSRPLTDLIPLERFPGVLSSMRYIIRAHSTGQLTKPAQPGLPSSLVAVSLDVRGWEILTAYPLQIFHTDAHGPVHLANLGLVGKMTGCAAVVRTGFDLLQNGRMFMATSVK